MRAVRLLLALLMLGCLALARPAAAEFVVTSEKIALVVGNSNYDATWRLKNPVNDATEIAGVLESIGFRVTRVLDGDRQRLQHAISRFREQARHADTAVFFFSGNGVEIEGENLMLPIDAKAADEQEVRANAIPLKMAMEAAAGASRLSVVIVDACRDNPFERTTTRGLKVVQGFSPVKAERRQVVAFSTGPGGLAYDGSGDLSPYSQALSEAIRRDPDADVRTLFTGLGTRVSELAEAQQVPYASFGGFDDKYVSLTGATPERMSRVTSAPVCPEAAVDRWEAARREQDVASAEAVAELCEGTEVGEAAKAAAQRWRNAKSLPKPEKPACADDDARALWNYVSEGTAEEAERFAELCQGTVYAEMALVRATALRNQALAESAVVATAKPAQAAPAEPRFALIIANQNYKSNVGLLSNTHEDAELLSAALKDDAFNIAPLVLDKGRADILIAIEEHARRVRAAGENATSFVYYTGHGAAKQSTKENFLIPVEADDARTSRLWYASIPLAAVLDILNEFAPDAAHIVVFDACREELQLNVKGGSGKGFAPVNHDQSGGMMVAYSASPGQVASDGDPGEKGGPYARIFVDELAKARTEGGVAAQVLFDRVGTSFERKYVGQSPWYEPGLGKTVRFGLTARATTIASER